MAPNRTIPTTGTGVSATSFAQDVSEELGGLWDRAACRLSGIGGTADAITATLSPALTAGLLVSGAMYHLVYSGVDFVIIGSSTLTKINDYQAFTTVGSATWNKPANCPDNAIVEIWGWGGGGHNTSTPSNAGSSYYGSGGGQSCRQSQLQ